MDAMAIDDEKRLALASQRVALSRAATELEWLQRGTQAVKRWSNAHKHAKRIRRGALAIRSGDLNAHDVVACIKNIAVDLIDYWELYDLLVQQYVSTPASEQSTSPEIDILKISLHTFKKKKKKKFLNQKTK